MEKFLIEIKNGGDTASCLRSIQSFLSSRSHFVTSVEWGCLEGESKAWLIIKTSNRADALRIIPAAYRQSAKITQLHKFTGKEINESMLNHTAVALQNDIISNHVKDMSPGSRKMQV
jgi:hypothetical protein